MIVRFPDHDFPHMTVEFDTDTYTAVYVTSHERADCRLSRRAWQERLIAWGINLQHLIDQDVYGVDEGL